MRLPGARRSLGLLLFFFASATGCGPELARAQDPVITFIVRADSIAQAGSETDLERYVERRAALVGAAVGQLLDIAFQMEPSDAAAAAENVDFAGRLARIHAQRSGSEIPLASVETWRGWDDTARATKRRAQELEAAANEARAAGDADLAVQRLEDARDLYRSIDDRRAEAVVWGSLGVAHWSRGDWDSVRASYEQALAMRRAIEDRILEGRTLNGLGSVSLNQDRLEESLEWYGRAVELRRQTGDLGGLGTSLSYRGNTYLRLGRPVEARRTFEQAQTVLEAVGDTVKVIQNLNGIANLYDELGRPAQAEKTYAQALEMLRVAPDFGTELTVRANLASTLRQQSKLREALDQLAAFGSLLGDDPDPGALYFLQRERGLTYLALSEQDEARTDLERALATAEQLGDIQSRIESLSNLGLYHRNEGQLGTALDFARRALALAEESEQEHLRRDTETLTGTILGRRGDLEAALGHLDTALELDRAAGREELVARDEVERANVLSRLGRGEEARRAFRASLDRLRQTGADGERWVPLLGLGDSFEQTDPDSAAYWYDEALAQIEATGARIAGSLAQTGFLSTQLGNAYEEIIRFFAGRDRSQPGANWADRAFEVSERAKGQGLRRLLEQSFAGAGDHRVEALLDSLFVLESRGGLDAPARAALLDELEKLQSRFLREQGAIADASEVATLESVRARLGPGTVVLAYAVGDSASHLWMIESTGHRLVPLPPRNVLRDEVRRLRTALQAPGMGDARLAQSAHELYQMLVAPVADALAEAGHVVLVPDDALHELPFEMLLVRPVDAKPDWRRAPYLGAERSLVYAPSATVYLSLLDRPAPEGSHVGVLAVGDPDFAGLPPRAGTSVQLDPLPHTRDEVRAIAGVSAAQVHTLVGKQATEAAWKQQLQQLRPRLVHLATHGLIDRAEPTLSCVALAPDSASDEDGYLFALEVLTQPLDVDLVVLSACETGRGRLERGEGVVGLTRAFLGGGARGVVASLWPVSDASTARLMEVFYRGLFEQRLSTAEALRVARSALIEDERTAHPWYWAAFVHVGPDRALRLQ